MHTEIQKLKVERKKLVGKRFGIDTKINCIDKAVEKFTEGLQVLSQKDKPRSASTEIETIMLASKKPMHVSDVHAELLKRKFKIARQSVSAILQRGNYKRTAPATFELRKPRGKAYSDFQYGVQENI